MIQVDIEKPDMCLLCPFSHSFSDSPFFDCHCNLLKRYIKEKDSRKVQDDCPIREVRHGRWLVTDAYPHRVYCSECFKTFAHDHWEIWQDGSLPRLYCPNCGARMDRGG